MIFIVEGVLQKIRRQIEELERISGVESTTLTVDGVPDEAKYPTISPLKEVVDNIQSQVHRAPEEITEPDEGGLKYLKDIN
ncbi:hypothetical protein Bca52824_055152 [Brassica carinata]|uniref:Uncharacterized protein n=1 Tax=Brassica carinata TaxID=52824 RepID=A0A8X7RA25_BRACI|nr:hypothetical protein Bca52824_055152 [Brassica carinata]